MKDSDKIIEISSEEMSYRVVNKKWYFIPECNEKYYTTIGGIGKHHFFGTRVPLIIGYFQVYEEGTQPYGSILASEIKWITIGDKYYMCVVDYGKHNDPHEVDIISILYVPEIEFEDIMKFVIKTK